MCALLVLAVNGWKPLAPLLVLELRMLEGAVIGRSRICAELVYTCLCIWPVQMYIVAIFCIG
jgi:hypothetical protein